MTLNNEKSGTEGDRNNGRSLVSCPNGNNREEKSVSVVDWRRHLSCQHGDWCE